VLSTKPIAWYFKVLLGANFLANAHAEALGRHFLQKIIGQSSRFAILYRLHFQFSAIAAKPYCTSFKFYRHYHRKFIKQLLAI
jgi:hypothetical protein